MAQRLRCDRFDLLPKPPQELEAEAESGALATDGDAPQWRAAARDLPARRRVVRRVLALLQTPAGHQAGHHMGHHAALVAKRVELALYSRAGSLGEYASPETLRRRVQALVAASVHEAHAQAAASPTGKRPSLHLDVDSSRVSKRRRHAVSASTTTERACSVFPMLPNEDLTRAVLSFLDGKQVLQLRVLNSLARTLLPACVFSIRLEVSQLRLALDADDHDDVGLAALSNLRQLVVHKAGAFAVPRAEREDSPAALRTPLHAWSCAELSPTVDNDGEDAVCKLARALRRFPKLESLQLSAVFCNTSTRNAARQLADALAAGACPRLRDLLLGGNHLADAGAVELARAVGSGGLPALERLDLRRNYVGDRGASAVLAALGHPPSASTVAAQLAGLTLRGDLDQCRGLRALCLGGNLLTDASATAVVALVQRARLAFLGLEDNFLSVDGVASVVRGAGGR
jgi:hypothetical protein